MQDKMMLSTHEFFKPNKKVNQTPRKSIHGDSSVDELTAIIRPQQVAEEKQVAARQAEFKLSSLEKPMNETNVPLMSRK